MLDSRMQLPLNLGIHPIPVLVLESPDHDGVVDIAQKRAIHDVVTG